jgi:hypothetical protein
MICPNCHKEIPDSAKVCGYCGTKLQNPAQPAVALPAAPITPPKTKGARAAQPRLQQVQVRPRKEKHKLPGWAWAIIGPTLLAVIVIALGLTRVIFIPYITPPPGPVAEVLSGARLTYQNGFNQLPSSKWEYDSRYVDLSNGVAAINGNEYDYPYIAYKIDQGIGEGHAILMLFKYYPGARWSFSLLSGYFGTTEFRQWGIDDDGEKYIAVGSGEWSSMQGLSGNLSLRPNTWYYLLLGVDNGPRFIGYLWERDNPSQKAQIQQSFIGNQWGDRDWVVWINGFSEVLTIDEFAEIRFSSVR